MQIPKISLFICALAVSGSLALHAQDNPAQAAARAALLDKMNELDTNPSATMPTPAPTVPASAADTVAPATVPVTPAATTGTATAVEAAPATDASQTAARAALLEKMNEPDTNSPATTPPPAPTAAAPVTDTVAPTAVPVAPAATTGAAATVEATPAADASKAEATAKANAQTEKIEVHNEAKAKRAALAEQKRAAAAAKKQAALEAKKRTEAEKHHIVVPANEPAKELGLSQVNAPALPISATKQEKLAALLQQYKADQLSPEEYQTRRAAIIAEP